MSRWCLERCVIQAFPSTIRNYKNSRHTLQLSYILTSSSSSFCNYQTNFGTRDEAKRSIKKIRHFKSFDPVQHCGISAQRNRREVQAGTDPSRQESPTFQGTARIHK